MRHSAGLNSRVPHYFKLSGIDQWGDPIVKTDTNVANLRAIYMKRGTLTEVKDGKARVLWNIRN